ncbi:hypothetical protein M3Y99_01728900 [Aphelenchoides fujianensis]|nr:hypothetical protein M3Y99_01728900 [Aphelenchoides fujianensis]
MVSLMLFLDLNKRVYNHVPGECSFVPSIETGAVDVAWMDNRTLVVSTGSDLNNATNATKGGLLLWRIDGHDSFRLELRVGDRKKSKGRRVQPLNPYRISFTFDPKRGGIFAVVNVRVGRAPTDSVELLQLDGPEAPLQAGLHDKMKTKKAWGLAYASRKSSFCGFRWWPHAYTHTPFTSGRLLLEFRRSGRFIWVRDTQTGAQTNFRNAWAAELLGAPVDCVRLGNDCLLALTHERLVHVELKQETGVFRCDDLHRFPRSPFRLTISEEQQCRLIAATAHPDRFVFAVRSSASKAKLHEVDVNTRAVRLIGPLRLPSGRIGGLHVHAGVLYVIARNASQITSIHALDPVDGRVLRVVEVEDSEAAGITRRGFPPAALAFHDHSVVFLEQLIVGEPPNRVLQPRLCRLDLRSGAWTAVETPVVAEIAASCWYSEWAEGESTWLEPVDLLHVDQDGAIRLHVRTSIRSAFDRRSSTAFSAHTWRSYQLHGQAAANNSRPTDPLCFSQPKSLLRMAFEALDPADLRRRPQTATIERIYR